MVSLELRAFEIQMISIQENIAEKQKILQKIFILSFIYGNPIRNVLFRYPRSLGMNDTV